MFIHQVSAAGFILQSVKPTTFRASIQGAYALLEPTSKGRDAIAKGSPVLLPECTHLQSLIATARTKVDSKHRTGKGKYMVPILKRLTNDEENWLKLTSSNKERYLFPGWHDSNKAMLFTTLTMSPCFHSTVEDIIYGKISNWERPVLPRIQCQWL